MRVAILACASCGKALDPDELQWCTPCVPRCDNCGASDHEQGPINPITFECVVCDQEHGDSAQA
jgi:hypothetical protein